GSGMRSRLGMGRMGMVGFGGGRPFVLSSRRRHTSSVSAFLLNRSSDLVIGSKHITLNAASGGIQGDVLAADNNTVGMGDAGIKRSEERRVGKECRSQWGQYDSD